MTPEGLGHERVRGYGGVEDERRILEEGGPDVICTDEETVQTESGWYGGW